MSQRSSGGSFVFMAVFLVLVFVVALGGTFLGLQIFGGAASDEDRVPRLITVEVIITATPDPNATPLVRIITATLQPGQVQLPTEVAGSLAGGGTPLAAATIDPTIIGADAAVGLTATVLPPNCILHTVVSGDTPFGIALQYGANPFDMLAINGLTEETATQLQLGQVLIVPLPGCALEPAVLQALGADGDETPTATSTDSDDEDATPDPDALPSPTPTLTLVPTAVNAQIEIVEVLNAGDITAEGVRIRNLGNSVNVTGWQLSDLDGNVYQFPEQILFSNAEITIYTRAGQNTPVALFWGLDTAVWSEPGDILTLTDARGQVQATLRLPSPVDLE